MGQILAPIYFQSLLAPCATLSFFGRVRPLCAGRRTLMSVWSDVPFETCNPRAAFTAIAVDRNLARPTGRMIEGQDYSLFGRQYLLVIMDSGLGSSADFSETTFSTATKPGASHDDGVFFGGVMPDFVDRPRLCRTPCTNTSAKTNKTTTAGPGCGHILCDVRVGHRKQRSHLEQRLGQYCRALDPRGRCKGNIVAGA